MVTLHTAYNILFVKKKKGYSFVIPASMSYKMYRPTINKINILYDIIITKYIYLFF